MKRYLLVSVVVLLLAFLSFTAAYPASQTPQIPGSYHLVLKDLLINPAQFRGGSKISVGVRLEFKWVAKVTTLPGWPGKKPKGYFFQIPTDTSCKLMSLRLQGLKLSETEVNLLQYYGPTSMFPAEYQYGGFQIVGFCVTPQDLKRGSMDIWGWAPVSPLACRDFEIWVDLDAEPKSGQPMAGAHFGLVRRWRVVSIMTAPTEACTFQQK